MEQVDQYAYYWLGVTLARLSDALPSREAKKFGAIMLPLFNAQRALNEFVSAPFFVHSRSVARDLVIHLNALESEATPKDDKEGPFNYDKEFQPWGSVSQIKRLITEIGTLLARECPTVPIFFIPPKGIYKTEDLINQAENMFSETMRKVIPSQAITDVHEAGRCIAFELPTAAGFHVLRATEALTREYYKFVINKDSGKTDWGKCIEELKEQAAADNGLLELLDQIRDERNTVMHPRRNLSMDEAIGVVNLAQAAISRTAIDMMNKGPQHTLSLTASTPAGDDGAMALTELDKSSA